LKRVAFCTFGCRLNQYDTETIRTLLENEGSFRTVSMREEADVYVVNTCSVTSRADATARKMIRRLNGENPTASIVVSGCYAQRAPEEVAALPGVNLVLGAADRGNVAVELKAVQPGGLRIAVSPVSEATEFLEVPVTEMMDRSRAYVKVQEGCNERCSFCIVPQTRGLSRSRDPGRVLDQVAELVESGYPEVVLTGVHIGDYGLDLPAGRHLLTELIGQILAQPGVERLRLSSIEPSTLTDEILDQMASEPRFARHLHVPFQSGSDSVLRAMRRRYTVGDFDRLVNRITARMDEFGLGTDVICGFPGETAEDFQATFDCLTRWPISYLHPFTYSVRPGSEAAEFGDPVPGDEKKRRTRSLKRLSQEAHAHFKERYVGREVDVLLESSERRGERFVSGLTDTFVRVELASGTNAKGMARVRVEGITPEGLRGRVVH
jgi:threonylcarbamoyladenosine tRNA methylthiotransferase MtaB